MTAPHDATEMDWALAGRYLAGELAPHERAAFERWLAHDAARGVELALVRQLWDDAGATPNDARVDAMWRSVQARMQARVKARTPAADRDGTLDRPASPARPEPRRRRLRVLPHAAAPRGRRAPLLAVAAAILAAVGLAERRFASERATAPPPPAREFRTAPGQRATVHLGDGTRVELGVASVLVVAPFGDGAREVTLRGEAMFDVVHDELRPFRVRTAGTVVEDLGTRFAVRSYDADARVRVVVTEGVVALHAPAVAHEQPRRVVAGELAHLDSLGNVTVEANADTARYVAWTSGRVLLRNETLRDAAAEIERWHDVRVVVADADVARMRITVDMHLGSLQKTLEAVTVPLGLRYDVNDRTARIHR